MFFMIGVVICSFSSISFAAKVSMWISGTSITRNGTGFDADQGTTILLYRQVGTRDPLTATAVPSGDDTPLVLEVAGSGGTPIDPPLRIRGGKIQTGAGSDGDRYVQVDVSPGDTIYARVWTPSAGVGSFYNVTSYSFPSDPAAFGVLTNPTWPWNMGVDYKASPPPPPSINRSGIGESLVRQGESSLYQVSLTVPVTPGTGYQVESATYRVKVWRDDLNDDPAESGPMDVRVKDGGTSFTFQNGAAPYDTYFQGAKSYHMKARAYNVFDYSAWSADVSPLWTTGGGGGNEVTQTWTFKKLAAGGGINTFSIPFTGLATIKDGYVESPTRDVSTVQKLIAEINRQAAALIPPITTPVTVFGWFDEKTQTHQGLTSIAYSGVSVNTAGSKATDVNGDSMLNEADVLAALATVINTPNTGKPYQVSVNLPAGTTSMDFKLKGFK